MGGSCQCGGAGAGMGQNTSTMAGEFAAWRRACGSGDAAALSLRFARGGVVHLFSAQDARPGVAFHGRAEIRDFLDVWLETFPTFALAGLEELVVESLGRNPANDTKTRAQAGAELDLPEPGTAPGTPVIEPAVVLSAFFDEDLRTAIVASKLPRRGYRFVQETLVMSGKEISLLAITVDCATEFSMVGRGVHDKSGA